MKHYLYVMIAASIAAVLMISGCVGDPVARCVCPGDTVMAADITGSGVISMMYSGARMGEFAVDGAAVPVGAFPGGELRGAGFAAKSTTRKVTVTDSSLPLGMLGIHQVLAEGSVQYPDGTHDHLSLYLFRIDSLDGRDVRMIAGGEEYDAGGYTPGEANPRPGRYAIAKFRLGVSSADYALADERNNRLYSSLHPDAVLAVHITSRGKRSVGEYLNGTMTGRLINAGGDTIRIDGATFTLWPVVVNE
ncbi:MAG: hypothetical protein ABIR47_17050 [Candidatus Kapaibacterium sp.]